MAYPGVARIELPILQELVATGGVEDVRFLYNRLAGYFPQLTDGEVRALENGHRTEWRRLVQRAGRVLADKREIERRQGRWTITQMGRQRVSDEGQSFSLADNQEITRTDTLTHGAVQQMLLDIRRVLGYHAQSEFDYYDIVWRESSSSP